MNEWMQLSIALFGAVTGTVSLLLQLLSYLREKPKLSLKLSFSIALGKIPEITVAVSNKGMRPTTIINARLMVDSDFNIQKVYSSTKIPNINGKMELPLTPEEPQLINPGEYRIFTYRVTHWPSLLHADLPLRCYVIDSNGSKTWGPARPLFRMLLKTGWKPPFEVPEELVKPVDHKIEARPIYPKWKIWQSKSLR